MILFEFSHFLFADQSEMEDASEKETKMAASEVKFQKTLIALFTNISTLWPPKLTNETLELG